MRSPLPWQTVLLLIPRLTKCQYVLQKDYFETNFFDSFDFFDGADPTNGFVQYTGQVDSLISSTPSKAEMKVSTEQSTPNGRPSVRITSKDSYETGLIVLDLDHMPGGICGTWPAFWTVGPNWPDNGEIDIIEGVNDVQTNQVTLHTGSTCSISTSSMTGSISTDNCDVSNGENTGCGITTTNDATYGTTFNNNGGGVYATLLTTSNIVVWFWPRDSIPNDVLGNPDPSSWSTPLANFSGSCNFGTAFNAQQLVFDTTFCGDWAGEVWSQGGCASKAATCEDYVASNGADFSEAYWSIKGLKVFQADSSSQPSTSLATPGDTVPPTTTLSSTVTSASSETSASSPAPVSDTSQDVVSNQTTFTTSTRPATATLPTFVTTLATSTTTNAPLPQATGAAPTNPSIDWPSWSQGSPFGRE